MNSKTIVLAVIFVLLTSCGVKAPPLKYPETIVDSYVQTYTGDKELTPEEVERTSDKTPVNVNETLVSPDKEKK